MNITTETIGPEEAAAYLDPLRLPDEGLYVFKGNRRIEKRRVASIARDMRSGHVDDGGSYDPEIPLIAFDENDHLCGGFHTLLSVIASGTTWEFRIKRKTKEALIPALNESRSGSARDELLRRGWDTRSSGVGQSVGRLLINFEAAHYPSQFSMNTSKTATAAEVANRADQDRDLICQATEYANELYGVLRVNRTISATAYTVFTQHMGEEKTRELFTKLITGVNLQDGEPAHWLRMKLERMRYDKTEGLRMAGAGSNRVWVAFLIASEAIANGNPRVRYQNVPRQPDARTIKERYIWWPA